MCEKYGSVVVCHIKTTYTRAPDKATSFPRYDTAQAQREFLKTAKETNAHWGI